MERCDVLVVGGGPAGSSCAWRLVREGVDVAVLDKARFPRDKVCAGWITPAVVQALALDLGEYGTGRTLQPFTGFRTGRFDGDLVLTDFHCTISYGIRRCEFDDYLIRRSGARLFSGQPMQQLRRDGDEWVVNGAIRARVIVGAGGHFCPIARWLNADRLHEDVIVAQEIEYEMDEREAAACSTKGESPELFFWPDLLGYGWCVRKGAFLNIGAGRLNPSEFPSRVRQFAEMLRQRGLIPETLKRVWKGHAYLLNTVSSRRVNDTGLLLAGDAAGLALAPSGEGILAAVESGLMAADAILAAGNESRDRFVSYAERLEARFGPRGQVNALARVPEWLTGIASRALLASPWLTRRILLERGFLHLHRAAA